MKLRVLAAVVVLALAGVAIWVASTKVRTSADGTSNEVADAAPYDYEARDVVMQQMGPDGALQYELEAKKITQLPRNGQITALDLVMHHDPAGSAPGGPNRLTITANRADLPESGKDITVQGNVHAEGRPANSRNEASIATEQLTYNFATTELFTRKPVDFRWGEIRLHCGDFRMNIKLGTRAVESDCNGTN